MKHILIGVYLFFMCFSYAQQTDYIDFKHAEAKLVLTPDSSKVSGSIRYSFTILRPVDSIYIDSKNMEFETVKLNDNRVRFQNDKKKLWIKSYFQKDSIYTISFNYKAYPKKALYFLKRHGDWNIWTQGQGKYTSNWLPSIDDVNDKIEFDLKISFNKNYKVLANGRLINKVTDSLKTTWHYHTKKPMSSYLVALAIGKYNKNTEVSKSGIPLEYYYYPEDSLKVEPTYRYSKLMFNYLEDEIGFAYPWQNYKQVPVHDFLYAGMENTSLTIFSDAFVVDSIAFNDRNYININAHELAHQWFGNLVTAQSGKHHWLQEGFATYYALLAERHILGNNHYYFKLYQSAQELWQQDAAGNGTSLLNPTSSSLTFYQRGAWVLHALRVKVGDVIFRQAVKNYLAQYQFANVKTKDFMTTVETLYGKSLADFTDKWVIKKPFPIDEAIQLLKNSSTFIQEYIMVDCEAKTSKCEDYLKYYISDEAKAKVIAQNPSLVTHDTFKSALKVRQAIAQYVTKISQNLKNDYETLLNDNSYITIENALYNLWVNFPLERSKYLAKTKNIEGFNDKNIRLLWLVLHLNTPEYQTHKKEDIRNELLRYTSNSYNADVRISAFEYLNLIKDCNAQCKYNLNQAKTHHNWRMVKFAKTLQAKHLNKTN